MNYTFTSLIMWPRWSPNWKTTVETLANLANIHTATFVEKRILWLYNVYLFEVMGSHKDVEWFANKLWAEDRKRKYIKFSWLQQIRGAFV